MYLLKGVLLPVTPPSDFEHLPVSPLTQRTNGLEIVGVHIID